ncbi:MULTISPECIES: hypothetical protein [Acinetobacter]|uniref:Uncharacterized protein n=2 Tax=Acinetobacter TaxID=469 RepID=A0A5P1UW82_9GAMM|nr:MULTISPECIES: hypothetical protein [Acinetobacter]MBO3658859.1 hypothetical protein [Acinetobacter haemolyticus]QER40568.1 hypothetical protein F2A31_13000 [Acinetobacter sp. C16S1]
MHKNKFLIAAAICSGVAALLHLGCIIFGGDWYRFFGAGEQMAQMAEMGHIYPTIVTLIIVTLLIICSLYALSGAGVILKLPLLRLALCVITTIYLIRGIVFIPLMPMFPENSLTFWLVSSTICIVFGLLYAFGIRQSWAYLSEGHTKQNNQTEFFN